MLPVFLLVLSLNSIFPSQRSDLECKAHAGSITFSASTTEYVLLIIRNFITSVFMAKLPVATNGLDDVAMDQQAMMIGTTGIDPSAYFSNAW